MEDESNEEKAYIYKKEKKYSVLSQMSKVWSAGTLMGTPRSDALRLSASQEGVRDGCSRVMSLHSSVTSKYT